MDEGVAETLVGELVRHSGIITLDKNLFLDLLVSTDVQESSRFYEALPDQQQPVQETNRCHYLSLRRILRNGNARNYQISRWKKAYEAFASVLGVYSSDALSRSLRANKDLIEMIAGCDCPFSLLGKLQTYDFDNSDQTLFIITRPILIIPNASNIKPIINWEKANTTYEKEASLFFFKRQRRIRSQEYFSQ